MTDFVLFTGEIVAAVIAVILGVSYLRSKIARANREELQTLVDARGKRIDDLINGYEELKKQHEQDKEEWQRRVTALEAKYQALVDIKANAIAVAVVDMIKAQEA